MVIDLGLFAAVGAVKRGGSLQLAVPDSSCNDYISIAASANS